METLRINLNQINTTVGDLKGNSEKIIRSIKMARDAGCDIAVFPELALCGYPPEDLLLKRHFFRKNREYLDKVIRYCDSIFCIVGFPYCYRNSFFNAAALIFNKRLVAIYRKMCLPNYGVFDEMRYFQRGDSCQVITLKNDIKLAVNICEDIWHRDGPMRLQALEGKARVIINVSASPYYARKMRLREDLLRDRAKEYDVFLFYCNLIGGQDELVFDGASMAFDPDGNVIARAKQFKEDSLIVDIDCSRISPIGKRYAYGKKERENLLRSPINNITVSLYPKEKGGFYEVKKERHLNLQAEIYSALTLGLRDYVLKNGFAKVILGLSGGIDSALAASIAVDALGSENVVALTMPSIYSSRATRTDARRVAENLGIKIFTLPINNIYKAYLKLLRRIFRNTAQDIAAENIQARIRGNLLMAFSNKFGWLVVTTGNKSELSVGYCTLYGDTSGGFAVIKDVSKTGVYKLARYRNSRAGRELIPESVLKRPPSAELRRGQKDSDTLPPYAALDKIIDAYIEKDMAVQLIIEDGFSAKRVKETVAMIDRNEYKRRQTPVGVKITPKAFGRDRRMPITNKFYE